MMTELTNHEFQAVRKASVLSDNDFADACGLRDGMDKRTADSGHFVLQSFLNRNDYIHQRVSNLGLRTPMDMRKLPDAIKELAGRSGMAYSVNIAGQDGIFILVKGVPSFWTTEPGKGTKQAERQGCKVLCSTDLHEIIHWLRDINN
ncbi:MAG: hypothetical protein HQM12_24110 [SAR324 cluster bacterium]|nr:hypothetical protein [SAR324 cluster bacterium]